MSSLFKQVVKGSTLALGLLLVIPAMALADSPSIASVSGSVGSDGKTVTMTGTWSWNNCGGGHAVGIAIDWDGGALNLSTPFAIDNTVHQVGNCNTGWGPLSHTFASASAIPSQICAVAYDIHLSGGAPKDATETTAAGPSHNDDNSVEKNLQTSGPTVCAPIVIPPPTIDIDKQGPATAVAGSDIEYTLVVTTQGPTRFPIGDVKVTDARCDKTAPAVSSFVAADANFLAKGDTWIYKCTARTKVGDTLVDNTANVDGTDELGRKVSDSDNLKTTLTQPPPPPGCTGPCNPPPLPEPKIAIAKADTGGPFQAGSPVTYNLTVTNPGPTSFPANLVVVADALCSSVPTRVGTGTDGSTGSLDPGDVWTYTCSVNTNASQTVVNNTATVTGTDVNNKQATASATAQTPLAQQGALPILPGSSRLRGPTGCIAARTHVLRVTGSRIQRVSFYLDGRYIGTRTRPNSGSAFTMTVRGAKLRRGSHVAMAKITYQADTNPQSRTLTLSFARCARAVTPKFTG